MTARRIANLISTYRRHYHGWQPSERPRDPWRIPCASEVVRLGNRYGWPAVARHEALLWRILDGAWEQGWQQALEAAQ